MWNNIYEKIFFISFFFLFYYEFPMFCNTHPTVKTYYSENCKKSDLAKLDKKYQGDFRKSSLTKKTTILFFALFLKLNADVGRIYRRRLSRFVFSSTPYRSKCSRRHVINRSKRIPIEYRELSRKAIRKKEMLQYRDVWNILFLSLFKKKENIYEVDKHIRFA